MLIDNRIIESIFIKDSKNQSYLFFKDNNRNLVFNKVNTDENSTIVDKDVLDFSATIDENNKLHLLYLHEQGELIYCVYSSNSWQKNLIGKLDTKSNIYKYLTLFIHKNTINIFYVFANLINLNLWTIEHITKNKDNLKKHIVANIFSDKIINPFYIDSDEFGNIYLVYSGKEYNHYSIYYMFFNTFTQIWTTTPTKISSSVTNNILPYIFVDTQNNVHILWYSTKNGDYFLSYKRFSSVGDSRFQWKEINLPKILGYNYPAIMIEKNDELNIICISDEKVLNLTSTDYGNTWIIKDETSVGQHPIYLIKYYNLSLNKAQNKINHYYGNIDNGNVSFHFDNFHEDLKINSDVLSNGNLENEIIDDIPKESEEESVFNSDNKEIEKLKSDLAEMQNQIEIVKNDIESIKDKLRDLEEKSNNKKGFFNIW